MFAYRELLLGQGFSNEACGNTTHSFSLYCLNSAKVVAFLRYKTLFTVLHRWHSAGIKSGEREKE